MAFDGVGGTEVLGGVNKRVVRANWKFGAEQFAGDSYHFAFTHPSALAALRNPDAPSIQASSLGLAHQLRTEGAHGMGFLPSEEIARAIAAPQVSVRAVHDWMFGPRLAYLTEKHGRPGKDTHPTNINIFPNLASIYPSELRVWQPLGPGEIEIWSWILVDVDAPAEVKDGMRKINQRTAGSMGIIDVDDCHNWVEAQNVLQGHRASRTRFNLEMGMDHKRDAAADSPGLIVPAMSEVSVRAFHRRWATLMSTEVSNER